MGALLPQTVGPKGLHQPAAPAAQAQPSPEVLAEAMAGPVERGAAVVLGGTQETAELAQVVGAALRAPAVVGAVDKLALDGPEAVLAYLGKGATARAALAQLPRLVARVGKTHTTEAPALTS